MLNNFCLSDVYFHFRFQSLFPPAKKNSSSQGEKKEEASKDTQLQTALEMIVELQEKLKIRQIKSANKASQRQQQELDVLKEKCIRQEATILCLEKSLATRLGVQNHVGTVEDVEIKGKGRNGQGNRKKKVIMEVDEGGACFLRSKQIFNNFDFFFFF